MNGLSCLPLILSVEARGARRVGRTLASIAMAAALVCGASTAMAQYSGLQPSNYDTENPAKSAVKLQFVNATWAEVFHKIAEASGSDLVADETVPGRFTRLDRQQYTRTEAVRILNRELEPKGFRLLEKGEHLVLFNLHDIRTEYRRPLMPQQDNTGGWSGQPVSNRTPRNFTSINGRQSAAPIRDSNVSPVEATVEEPPAPRSRATQPRLTVPRPAATAPAETADELEETEPAPAPAARPKPRPAAKPRVAEPRPAEPIEEEPQERRSPNPLSRDAAERLLESNSPHEVRVPLQRQTAIVVARTIYESCQSRSKLLDNGPGGLPAFTVRQVAARSADKSRGKATPAAATSDDFTIGIDSDNNELVVSAPPARVRQVERLVQTLDTLKSARNDKVRVVLMSGETHRVAAGIQAAIAQVLAQNERRGTGAEGEDEEPETPPRRQPERPPEALPNDLPAAVPQGPVNLNLLGPVQIREVPGVGMVVTGAKADVDAVMAMIDSLKLAGGAAVPDVHLLMLKHVQSEGLAELLNDVYQEMSQVRSPLTGQQQQTVRIVPVVKPNAVIIVATGRDMESVLDLAEALDQPVDPSGEFEVFRLKHAVASQVVTSLDSFYQTRAPMGTRVRTVADVRTNSLVVYARPNDLIEVARLVKKLDQPSSAAVARMRVFPLKNATATELANLINQALQSVVRPPQTATGAAGQPGVGAPGAGGTGPQQLQDVRSAILEFLAVDGDQQKLVRSGILADIRVTADPGRNTLLVAAPETSMPLMEALILQLDQPTPLVAEIKVFTLSNSDATATAELLRSLFTGQTQNQQQQGGFFNQQGQQQGGLQLAGAEGAGAGLIPLRFSVDARTNTIIAVGSGDALQIVEAVLLRLDESDIRQRKNTVIKLKNTFANDIALAINQFLTAQRDLAQVDPNLVTTIELLEREIIVVPEVVSNSLLISATPRYYDEIVKLVQDLDKRPPEVTIQALIVEVDLTNVDEFGVELGFQDRILFNRSIAGVPGFLFNNLPLGNNTGFPGAGQVGGQGLSNFSVGRTNADQGFGGLVLSASSDSISVLIRALSSKRSVTVLSRPQIRTLDNQIAQIQVGQQVPVATGVQTTGLTAASPQVQLRDVGIVLNVIPRISPDGTIVMEVVANRSSLSATRVPIFTDINTGNTVDSPVINVTIAQATVSVPNGQTVVLGGMISKSDDAFERKVPWLGDIPYLGNAFRYEGVNTRRTELLIFLTPRVIRHESDSELIKRVEAERMHFVERDAEELHGPLYSAPPPDWYLNRPEGGPAAPPGVYGPPGVQEQYSPIPAIPSQENGQRNGNAPQRPVLPDPPPPAAWNQREVPTTVMPSQPMQGIVPLRRGERSERSVIPERANPQGPFGSRMPPLSGGYPAGGLYGEPGSVGLPGANASPFATTGATQQRLPYR